MKHFFLGLLIGAALLGLASVWAQGAPAPSSPCVAAPVPQVTISLKGMCKHGVPVFNGVDTVTCTTFP